MEDEVVEIPRCFKCQESVDICRCFLVSKKQNQELKKLGFLRFKDMLSWASRKETRDD